MAITDSINCDCDSGPSFRTLAQLRADVMVACGFTDVADGGDIRQLQDLRAQVHRQLGFSAMGSSYAPGMSDLIDAWLNDAQRTIWSRISAGDDVPVMVADTDTCTYRSIVVTTLALGLAKAHYGMPDARVYLDRFERLMGGSEAKPVIDTALKSANRQLFVRYDALHTERWFSWTITAGVADYGLTANVEACTKRLNALKVRWVGVQDSDGAGWRPLTAGIPPGVYGPTQAGRLERYEIHQCIQVWPVPAETQGSLVIKGHFGPEAFETDTDVPTVDDELVFLMAVANVKAAYKQPDANSYVAQMETHLRKIVAGSHTTRRYIPGIDAECVSGYVEPKFVGPW